MAEGARRRNGSQPNNFLTMPIGMTTRKKIIPRMIGVVIKDSHLANSIHQRLGKTSAFGNKSPRIASAEPAPRRPVATASE